MDIGKPKRRIVIEPLEQPVPSKTLPEPQPTEPSREPLREPART